MVSASRNMQTTVDVKALGPTALVPSLPLWLHIACCMRRYDITFLLYGAACPSSLSSLTMGEIDLLVSQIPASVFFFLSEKDFRPSLTSHNFI